MLATHRVGRPHRAPAPRVKPGTRSCGTSAATPTGSNRGGSTKLETSRKSGATRKGSCSARRTDPPRNRSRPRRGSARTTPTGPSPRACTYRADATAADQAGLVPTEGATAGEYIEWLARDAPSSLPALVNLAPYVDDTCEATLRACPDCAGLFRELDTKNYQPGNLEAADQELQGDDATGPAAFADPMRYVNDDGTPAIPEVKRAPGGQREAARGRLRRPVPGLDPVTPRVGRRRCVYRCPPSPLP